MSWDLEEVLESVLGATGEYPLESKRLEGGTVNTILSVRLATRHVIVRIPRDAEGEEELLLNQFCTRRATRLGVPIASVVDILELSRGQFISIEECLPGCTLDKVSIEGKLPTALIRDVASAINKLHQGQVQGFGRLDRQGVGSYSSWEGFILGVFDDTIGVEHLVTSRMLLAWEIEAAEETLASHARWLWNDVGRLLHGDLDYGNVMADCARLSGLIDWGDATSGDPVYDLVRLEFLRGLKLVRAILRIGGEFEVRRLERPAADCYRLRIALESALWKARVGDLAGAMYARDVARTALQRLLKR